jgi:hypothetical protein
MATARGVLAGLLQSRGDSQHLGIRPPVKHHNRSQRRFPLGQCARLVNDEGVDLFEPFERLGVLHEDTGRSATPGSDHDRHRRRQSERAGTRDDEHSDRAHECSRELRRRSPDAPGDERDGRHRHDRGDEVRRDAVGKTLNRGAAALCLTHHPNDLREQRVTPDAIGAKELGCRSYSSCRP